MPGNPESTVHEITGSQPESNNNINNNDNNNTASDSKPQSQNALNTSDRRLAEVRALKNELKHGISGRKSDKQASDMAPLRVVNLTDDEVESASVKKATSPKANGDTPHRPTSTLAHVASRDSTNDGFGGCTFVRDRYGEDIDKASAAPNPKPLSQIERNGLGNLSTSCMGGNARLDTIHQQNGIGHTSRSISTVPTQDVPVDHHDKDAAPSKPSSTLDALKPISYTTPLIPVPSPYDTLSTLLHPPSSSSPSPSSPPKPTISPSDLKPGDQIVEHIKRIHQGGLAPPPDCNLNLNLNSNGFSNVNGNGFGADHDLKPIPAPGKTLLTIVSAQGTKYLLSDKQLEPGQQIVESVEIVREVFALPDPESEREHGHELENNGAAQTKRRWSWFGSLGSPAKDKAGVVSGIKAESINASASGADADGETVNERPIQPARKSSFIDSVFGRSPTKPTSKGKEKEKVKDKAVSIAVQEEGNQFDEMKPSQSKLQKEVGHEAHWFDKILDGLSGRPKEKLEPGVKN